LRQHQSDQIRVLDRVSGEPLDELLTNAKLFVLHSDLEGLSLALLDAMGAGGLRPGQRYSRKSRGGGRIGITFRRGGQDDLERMLRLLISEPEIRKAAASKAKERVWEHYFVGPRGARD
jgi:glycosyltransferase involved in cell wall biosynthesis